MLNYSQNPPKALALYIHWPFCKAKCPYCDFNSHVRESVEQDRWRTGLLQELRWFSTRITPRPLTSIFFGGGTPSLMPPATAEALIQEAEKLFGFDPTIEITLEANPTSVEANTFADFKQAGINRVSLGVQALNDADLKFLGRQHSHTEALKAVERATAIFPRYSFDLIYARPGQTVDAWEQELTRALTYAGTHLSLYQLTIEENTAFHHAHKKGEITLPDEDTSANLYLLTESMMQARGLPAYEVSNYAKQGHESRHNLAYWRGDEYIGIGPGAHGRISSEQRAESNETSATSLSTHYSPLTTRNATQTLKSPERWLESVERDGHGLESDTPLTDAERHEEYLLMRLRLTEPVTFADMPFPLERKFLERASAQGMISLDDKGFVPTLDGRLVLTKLTGELLGY